MSVFKVIRMAGEKLKLPEDWSSLVKTLKYKDRKVLTGIHNIPNNLEALYKERQQIMKMKTQVFGKSKISMTTFSASFQRESRNFANLFMLVIQALQQMKKEKATMDETKATPFKNEERKLAIEVEDTESELPRESCDEASSIYQ